MIEVMKVRKVIIPQIPVGLEVELIFYLLANLYH